jgi:hypothetical protein
VIFRGSSCYSLKTGVLLDPLCSSSAFNVQKDSTFEPVNLKKITVRILYIFTIELHCQQHQKYEQLYE